MLMIKKFEGEKMIFLKITSPRAKKLTVKVFFAERKKTLGEEFLRREFFLLSAKNTFTESFFLH
jgi:hypothetical protein